MKQQISMFIDMTEETEGCMIATYHDVEKPYIDIHSAFCPVVIKLTRDQVFHLMIELQSLFRKVSLPLKEGR